VKPKPRRYIYAKREDDRNEDMMDVCVRVYVRLVRDKFPSLLSLKTIYSLATSRREGLYRKELGQ
jgi:hypothetical protein